YWLRSKEPLRGPRVEAQHREVTDRAFQADRPGVGLAAEDQAAERAAGVRIPPARVLFAIETRSGRLLPVDDIVAAHLAPLVVIPTLISPRDAGAGKDRSRLLGEAAAAEAWILNEGSGAGRARQPGLSVPRRGEKADRHGERLPKVWRSRRGLEADPPELRRQPCGGAIRARPS